MTAVDTCTVRDTMADRAGALLDELDTLIAQLDAALTEANTARLVIGDAETEMEMRAASAALLVEARNEAERKARLTLALGEDAGYQQLATTVRHARASLLTAERTASITKQRMALVKAALALLAPSRMGETE